MKLANLAEKHDEELRRYRPAATELLGSAFLVNALETFIAFFWKVVLAVLIFAIDLYFANLARNTIVKTGTNQASLVSRLTQFAISFSRSLCLCEHWVWHLV